ncbi:MAG: hypothetical protein OCD01_16830 [Fibrobacterales bacterium]
MSLGVLKSAIEKRSKISFGYIKAGKVRGVRVGDPYAVYNFHRKDGSVSVKVDVFQTGGVSDSETNPYDWRMFDLDDLVDVELVIPQHVFVIDDEYDPYSNRYDDCIVKI